MIEHYPISPVRIRKFADLPWSPSGRILDPFAGLAKTWSGMNADITYTDLKPQFDGVVQADAAALPFADGEFDQIWTDPPHLIRNDVANWTKGYARFGNYRNRRELEQAWPVWSVELRRVCNGRMMLKTIDGGDHRVVKLADLAMFETEWELMDIIGSKTSPPWATTTTLYSWWFAR